MVLIPNWGIYCTMIVSGNAKGTWHIKDKVLYENATAADFTIVSIELSGNDLIDDQSAVQEFKEAIRKQSYYDIVIPLKYEILGEGTSRIVTLNENECTIVDGDGEKSTSRRISE